MEKVNLDLSHCRLPLAWMGMVFLAKDNEHHTAIVQHRIVILSMWWSKHFCWWHWLKPIEHHPHIQCLDNKPEKNVLDHWNIRNYKFEPQIHWDCVIQYLLQQCKWYSLCHYQQNEQHFPRSVLEIPLFVHRQLQDRNVKVGNRHHVYTEDEYCIHLQYEILLHNEWYRLLIGIIT